MDNVKAAIRYELKDMFKRIRINGVEYVEQYMRGMHDIIVYRADVTVVDFLDKKVRGTVVIEYDPALAGDQYRQIIHADDIYDKIN